MQAFDNRKKFIFDLTNHPILTSDFNVNESIGLIVTQRDVIDQIIIQKTTDTSGNTPAKTAAETLAIATLGNKARSCAVKLKRSGLTNEATTCSRPKSYYTRQKDQEIVSVLTNTRNILFTNRTLLSTYVNTDWFTLVDLQIQNLADEIATPTSARQAIDSANTDLNTNITLMNELNEDINHQVIDAFETTRPAFVEAFIATDNHSTLGKHHDIIDFSALNHDASPINRLQIDIIDTATNLLIKTLFTDVHGLANTTGKIHDYYAKAHKDGLIDQQILFRPIHRDTIHVDFIMQPTA